MSFSTQRKRRPTEIISGGLRTVFQGVFGRGDANDQLSSPEYVGGQTRQSGGVYHMHEGDLFTPGTGNWVLDPSQETALQTVWGHAFLRVPNVFNPIHPQIVFSDPTVVTNGLAGLIAGQMVMQPLIVPAPEQGG